MLELNNMAIRFAIRQAKAGRNSTPLTVSIHAARWCAFGSLGLIEVWAAPPTSAVTSEMHIA
jgi:hypothetical protein